MDTWVGRLLEKIDYCCPEDTAVIFHSDHGFNVGDHGRFGKSNQDGGDRLDWPYYDEVSHAALMIRLPGAAGRAAAGRRSEFLAQSVDLMPTLLELAGLALPAGVKGTSLLRAVRSEAMPDRPVVVTTPALDAATERIAHHTEGASTLHYRGNRDPYELFHLPDDPAQEQDLARSAREPAQRLHALHLDLLAYAGVGSEVMALRNTLPPLP